jgi:RNA polymerase sigma factor (TIGR02999 family)
MATMATELGHPSAGGPPDGNGAGEAAAVGDTLERVRRGEAGALDRLTALLYRELRQLASRRLRSERAGHTLGTTALVNEAYLRLADQRKLTVDDREAFLAAASTTMRRVLIDYARARRRVKRGGDAVAVPIDDVAPFLSDRACEEMIELDQALSRLETARPRAARIFEQRVFGGRSLAEIAAALAVSTKTVQREWDAARAWLRKEVRRGLETSDGGDGRDAGDNGGGGPPSTAAGPRET